MNTDICSPRSVEQCVQLFFVDPDGNPDMLLRKMVGRTTLLARPWVLYQRLALYKALNPSYSHVPLPVYEELVAIVRKCNSTLLAEAVSITDATALQLEREMGSDIANVQQTETGDHCKAKESKEKADTLQGEDPLPIRCSYVMGGLDACNPGHKECLEAVGKMVGVEDKDQQVSAAMRSVAAFPTRHPLLMFFYCLR